MIRLLYRFSKILEPIFQQQGYIFSVQSKAFLIQDFVHMHHEQCYNKDRFIVELKTNQEKDLSIIIWCKKLSSAIWWHWLSSLPQRTQVLERELRRTLNNITITGFLGCPINYLPSSKTNRKIRSGHPSFIPAMIVP